MFEVKITFFEDKKLNIRYGALIETNSGVTKVAHTAKSYSSDLIYKIRESLAELFNNTDEKEIFQKLEK